MFGSNKKDADGVKLDVQVHMVSGAEVFSLGQKLWAENARTVQFDQRSGKEFLHFGYLNPKCVVWFQRDHGRTDELELIIRWNATKTYEVLVLINGPAAGNQQRATAVLQSMLTTPSVVTSPGR